MNLSDSQILELSDLCSAVVDETLTNEERIRLESLLKNEPEARAYYIRSMAQSADLYERAADSQTDAPDLQRVRRTPRYWLMATVMAAAACVLLSVMLFKETSGPSVVEEPATQGVATLELMSGQEWGESQSALGQGAILEPGRIQLKSGLIQLRFFSGAEVVVRGPADFSIVSAMECECRRGVITARVPPQARLFRIASPQVTVVDLGTEFGLSVQETSTEVHVFNGRVNLLAPKSESVKQALGENESVQILGLDAWKSQAASRDAFPSLDKLRQETDLTRSEKWKAWQASSKIPHPGLILHYTFEPEADRSVLKNAAKPSQNETQGVSIGCEWVSGRWPEKGALEFKGVGDRVRFGVSGDFPAATWATWIRIHSLQNSVNALLTFDSLKKGQYHWHISSKGEIRFGIRYKDVLESARSPEVVKPSMLGQWIHVATTYDSVSGQIVHYLNGREVSRHSITANVLLKLESAEIGNWKAYSGSGDPLPKRNFSGRIDEMMFFDRVLPGTEILKLFTAGDPNTLDVPAN